MKLKKIGLIVLFSAILLINLSPVSANQISVIGAATTSTTTQQTVEIPAGDYHVYIEANGDLGASGTAICTASNGTTDVFAWSTSQNTNIWTGQITFSYSTSVTFTFKIETSIYSYDMTFQIVFTDMDVATITKTGIISDAPYGLEIIGFTLIGLTLVLIRKRRQ